MAKWKGGVGTHGTPPPAEAKFRGAFACAGLVECGVFGKSRAWVRLAGVSGFGVPKAVKVRVVFFLNGSVLRRWPMHQLGGRARRRLRGAGLPSTARSMMVGRVFLVLTGACQFGHGVGGFTTNFIHSSLEGGRSPLETYEGRNPAPGASQAVVMAHALLT